MTSIRANWWALPNKTYIWPSILTIDFRVPQEDPSGHSMIIERPEFDRLRKAAYMTSKDQKQSEYDIMQTAKHAAAVINSSEC